MQGLSLHDLQVSGDQIAGRAAVIGCSHGTGGDIRGLRGLALCQQ
jgi:hypothetical protein